MLVVDDFEPFRRVVLQILEASAEFQVIDQASDGLEAVQKAELLQPDLVLLDIDLPRLNGIEVANRIRDLFPKTKILSVSQHVSSDVVQEALLSGSLGYVHKSRVQSELLSAMRAVLGDKQFVSEDVAGNDLLRRSKHYSCDFDPTNRIVRFQLRGRVTYESMRDFRDGTKAPIHRTDPIAGVLDTTMVVSFDVSAREMSQLASAPPIVPDPDFSRVVIAPSTNVYGLMRLFAIQAEVTRRNLHVVRTEREAWAILGVQNPRFEPVDIE